jgi:hypothetical protein
MSEPHAGRRPVLILSLPRSFSSIVSTMLGQHPELYGFPELHLFAAERMTEWTHQAARTSFSMEHGLLRTVAQLFWGEQTPQTIKLARGWVMKRRDFTTGMMFDTLLQAVHPREGVEKGPTLISRPEYMKRALRLYPEARFIHLVRAPASYGGSVLRLLREEAARDNVSRWLLEMLYYPNVQVDARSLDTACPLSAQRGWYTLNSEARSFLQTVPAHQQRLVRGEDLLKQPRQTLRALAEWLQVDTGEEALAAMMHPEHSPYASFGPEGARNGGDPHFLEHPEFRPSAAGGERSASRIAVRTRLRPEVARLANELGYETGALTSEERETP